MIDKTLLIYTKYVFDVIILFQNNNVIMDTVLPSSRPASNALSSISIDENTLELRDVDQDDSILDELDISKYLVLKKSDEEGPDIRGGHPDALLIHATKANKHGTYMYIFNISV